MLEVSSTTSNVEIVRWGARPQGGGDKGVSAALPLLDDVFNIAFVVAPCIHPFIAPKK